MTVLDKERRDNSNCHERRLIKIGDFGRETKKMKKKSVRATRKISFLFFLCEGYTLQI
jgi:hypothetical protein